LISPVLDHTVIHYHNHAIIRDYNKNEHIIQLVDP
jgi:hypothetical protein